MNDVRFDFKEKCVGYQSTILASKFQNLLARLASRFLSFRQPWSHCVISDHKTDHVENNLLRLAAITLTDLLLVIHTTYYDR